MRVAEEPYPAAAHDYASDADELEQVDSAFTVAPRGALTVSGIAVGLLLLCWLAIYLFVFLPRGTVG
jgi:hypothetical protein